MDLVARKKLNLEVLKRHDANICDILDQSAHAVVYKFDTEKTSWEKLGYEGVIFLTQGKSAPYFGLYVLNRLSIENFSLHLTDFEEINLTDEFIIYQTSEGEACALWLFEKKDRERILAKILKLHEGIKALPSTQQQQQQQQQQQKQKQQQQLQQKQQPKPTESKVDILQMLKQATNNSPSTTASPPLQSVGNDLLSVLGQKSQQQPQPQQPQPQQPQPQQQPQLQQPQPQHQQQTQHLPHHQPPFMQHPSLHHPSMINQTPPNFAIPISECADRAGNRLQELFDSTNHSMANLNMNEPPQRRVMANGELTKPFYPPFVNMSPAASPNNRNPGALLQALHGGLPPPPPPPQQQQSVPMGMPLMPQQVMGLMRPEVGRRFGGGRPMLSKPEFIQQLLNMIQCDPTFFDVLYENYKGQMGPPPPPPV